MKTQMWPFCDVTEVSELFDGSTLLLLTPSKDEKNHTSKAVNRAKPAVFFVFFFIFQKLLLINVSISKGQNVDFTFISPKLDCCHGHVPKEKKEIK